MHSCIEVSRKNHFLVKEEEFESIIAQLEKTMIAAYPKERTSSLLDSLEIPFVVVRFQNPSIKDFLYQYLAENLHQYGSVLIQGCPFINQLLLMFKTTESTCYIDEGLDDDAFISKEKVRLPKAIGDVLKNRVIFGFNTLKYSYVEESAYENRPSVYFTPESYIIRKLNDIVVSFGINEDEDINKFIINKVKSLCTLLHEEEYPFYYDDMVEFPYLIQAVMPLFIDLDGSLITNDYYARSRFAEHLLSLNKFKEIFPKEYSDFMKINYKNIKRIIKDILLDDIDFFASDAKDEKIAFLVDMVYPEILECYKLRDSKKFWEDYRMINGYFGGLSYEETIKRRKERIAKLEKEMKIEKENGEKIGKGK